MPGNDASVALPVAGGDAGTRDGGLSSATGDAPAGSGSDARSADSAGASASEVGAAAGDASTGPAPSPQPAQAGLGRTLGYPGWLPTTPKRGWVIVYQQLDGGGGFHFFEFYVNADPRRGEGCTFTQAGPCVVRRCPAGAPTSSTEPTDGEFVNAGLVTVSGDKGRAVMRDWSFQAGTRYYNRHHDGRTWINDEKLMVTAAGATVPAFQADGWTYPALLGEVAAARLGRQTGGTLRWTVKQGSAGNLVFNFGGSPNVTCFGPLAAGSLTVPPEAAAALTPGQRDVLPTTADFKNLQAGEFSIYLEAREQRYPAVSITVE
jgi:hypothetical protein